MSVSVGTLDSEQRVSEEQKGATAVRRPGTISSETRTAGNTTCLSQWLGEWRGVNRGRADNIDQGEK